LREDIALVKARGLVPRQLGQRGAARHPFAVLGGMMGFAVLLAGGVNQSGDHANTWWGS
jgi:hypothetical protein